MTPDNQPIPDTAAPALLRLWTAAALPLDPDVATRLRRLLAQVAILRVPGLPEAAGGDAAMASRLALGVIDGDDMRRDLVMTALLLNAGENGACQLILDHARIHDRRRRLERAVEVALSPPCGDAGPPAGRLPDARTPSVQN